MGRSVLQLIIADEVMNHLVDNSIFDFCFRKVNAGIDTQLEVIAYLLAVLSFSGLERTNTQESLRITELYGQFGELPGKHLLVELLKLLFDIWYRCLHLFIICKSTTFIKPVQGLEEKNVWFGWRGKVIF